MMRVGKSGIPAVQVSRIPAQSVMNAASIIDFREAVSSHKPSELMKLLTF